MKFDAVRHFGSYRPDKEVFKKIISYSETTLYIGLGSLSFDKPLEDLLSSFEDKNIQVFAKRNDSKNYAIVEFKSKEDSKAARQLLSENGYLVKLAYGKEKDETNLFVKNLPVNKSQDEIKEIFNSILTALDLPTDKLVSIKFLKKFPDDVQNSCMIRFKDAETSKMILDFLAQNNEYNLECRYADKAIYNPSFNQPYNYQKSLYRNPRKSNFMFPTQNFSRLVSPQAYSQYNSMNQIQHLALQYANNPRFYSPIPYQMAQNPNAAYGLFQPFPMNNHLVSGPLLNAMNSYVQPQRAPNLNQIYEATDNNPSSSPLKKSPSTIEKLSNSQETGDVKMKNHVLQNSKSFSSNSSSTGGNCNKYERKDANGYNNKHTNRLNGSGSGPNPPYQYNRGGEGSNGQPRLDTINNNVYATQSPLYPPNQAIQSNQHLPSNQYHPAVINTPYQINGYPVILPQFPVMFNQNSRMRAPVTNGQLNSQSNYFYQNLMNAAANHQMHPHTAPLNNHAGAKMYYISMDNANNSITPNTDVSQNEMSMNFHGQNQIVNGGVGAAANGTNSAAVVNNGSHQNGYSNTPVIFPAGPDPNNPQNLYCIMPNFPQTPNSAIYDQVNALHSQLATMNINGIPQQQQQHHHPASFHPTTHHHQATTFQTYLNNNNNNTVAATNGNNGQMNDQINHGKKTSYKTKTSYNTNNGVAIEQKSCEESSTAIKNSE